MQTGSAPRGLAGMAGLAGMVGSATMPVPL